MLLSDELKTTGEGRKKESCVENQIGFYEHLKVILIRPVCMCIPTGSPKRNT
jgi:hypothetical protein